MRPVLVIQNRKGEDVMSPVSLDDPDSGDNSASSNSRDISARKKSRDISAR
jgi:hypothetical protein